MKHFHLAVESLNTRLVEQFETGSDPGSVASRVANTLVPAIHILQARTNKTPGGRDATLLEEVIMYFQLAWPQLASPAPTAIPA